MLTAFQRTKAERHFEGLDTNGDGVLTFDDLLMSAERMLALEGEPTGRVEKRLGTVDAGRRAWWDQLTLLDRDADGEITPAEFLHGYARLLLDSDVYREEARKGAGARFDPGDVDGDGRMDEEEFVSLFQVSFGLPREVSVQVFSRFLPEFFGPLSRR
ncbi:hypothetical protein R6V09_18615 [Streptomyces sp. W16]|uniref:EF-hand domain-containing protein n=1 Tax=Streptomyces sp. W16 TaxID=3076631 RepID=UPI00295B59DA|nr:hypothetical protein [Streptomyces sp. W16]MDV9172114.1 hypothetical protein [Streptomyces sp. W16]